MSTMMFSTVVCSVRICSIFSVMSHTISLEKQYILVFLMLMLSKIPHSQSLRLRNFVVGEVCCYLLTLVFAAFHGCVL